MDLKTQIQLVQQSDFSLSVAKHISENEAKDANFVISPLLMHVALGVTAAGSGGPTRDQLLGYLKSNSLEELNSLLLQIVTNLFTNRETQGGPCLSLASGVWIDESLTLNPAFKETLEEGYKSTSRKGYFRTKAGEVTKEANAWVEKKTNGLIKQVLPSGSVNPMTRLIMASALYFKAAWVHQFDAELTRERNFYLPNGSSVKVPFMNVWKHHYLDTFDDFKVLYLPYKSGRDMHKKCSMYIFLPDARDGLPALLDKLDKLGSISGFIETHLTYAREWAQDFGIPKFKIEFGFEASDLLKRQGLHLPFSPGGLTEMVNYPDAGKELFVSGMFQKSFIEVDETGTEAASANNSLAGGGAPPRVVEFVADHPFLFVVREDASGVVLFVGQVNNPLAG